MFKITLPALLLLSITNFGIAAPKEGDPCTTNEQCKPPQGPNGIGAPQTLTCNPSTKKCEGPSSAPLPMPMPMPQH